jgi:hypothetical protein
VPAILASEFQEKLDIGILFDGNCGKSCNVWIGNGKKCRPKELSVIVLV